MIAAAAAVDCLSQPAQPPTTLETRPLLPHPHGRSGRRIVFVGCGTSYHASLATR